MGRQKINLSQAFAGQRVGVKQVADKIWLVGFITYDLGFFDHETCRIESVENTFVAEEVRLSIKRQSLTFCAAAKCSAMANCHPAHAGPICRPDFA